MTKPQLNAVNYTPLPPEPNPQTNAVIYLLPFHRHHRHHRRHHRHLRRYLLTAAAILLLTTAVILLFPSDPSIQLVRLSLNHVKITTSPKLSLNVSLSVTVKVQNRDFFSVDYDTLDVAVGYRGRELGVVRSGGGHVKAKGRSYVNATVDVDGFEVVHDVFYLVEDLAKGEIPFDSETRIDGKLGLFFFDVPIKAKVSCEILVNINNQTITRQDCS